MISLNLQFVLLATLVLLTSLLVSPPLQIPLSITISRLLVVLADYVISKELLLVKLQLLMTNNSKLPLVVLVSNPLLIIIKPVILAVLLLQAVLLVLILNVIHVIQLLPLPRSIVTMSS